MKNVLSFHCPGKPKYLGTFLVVIAATGLLTWTSLMVDGDAQL
jgi:hypothetical protein